MTSFFYDLTVSVLGGVIAALILTWFAKPELKRLLSKESLRRILSKELLVAGLLIALLTGYTLLVKRGVLPPPELRDYITLYDEEGNEYLYDSFHPEHGKMLTGQKRLFPKTNVSWPVAPEQHQ